MLHTYWAVNSPMQGATGTGNYFCGRVNSGVSLLAWTGVTMPKGVGPICVEGSDVTG